MLMEDNLREKNQQVVELEVKTNRLAQENKLLEDRNKFLLVHMQGSPTSPKEKMKVSEAPQLSTPILKEYMLALSS